MALRFMFTCVFPYTDTKCILISDEKGVVMIQHLCYRMKIKLWAQNSTMDHYTKQETAILDSSFALQQGTPTPNHGFSSTMNICRCCMCKAERSSSNQIAKLHLSQSRSCIHFGTKAPSPCRTALQVLAVGPRLKRMTHWFVKCFVFSVNCE